METIFNYPIFGHEENLLTAAQKMDAGETDRQTLYNASSFETVLSTVVNCFRASNFDDGVCELLISNLKLFKKNESQLSRSMENSLLNIVIYSCCKCCALEVSNDVDISCLLDLVEVILSNLDSKSKVSTIAVGFSKLISALQSVLRIDTEHRSIVLVNLLRLMNVFLNFLAECETTGCDSVYIMSFDQKTAIEELIPRVLLLNEPKLITHSLSIIKNYYRFTHSSSFIDVIWKSIVRRLLEDEHYAGTCVSVLMNLLRLQLDAKEESIIANSNDFWIVLKKCFRAKTAARKRVLSVLKYVFLKDDFQSEYRAWWTTYFVIMDSLDEKQSHLIVPTLKLIANLKRDEIEVDYFWILTIIQQAAMHDSRTVRIKAFFHLFELDANHFGGEHLQIVVEIMRAYNDVALFRKIFQTKSFDAFKERFIRWVRILNSTTFCKLFFDDIVAQKWSPVPLYYVLEIVFEFSEPCPKFTCDRSVKTFLSNVTHSHNVTVRSAVQVLFLRILLRSKDPHFDTALQLFETLNWLNEKECLQRGTRTWLEICEFLRSSVDFASAEEWLMNELSNKVDCGKRSLAGTLCSLARNIALLHDALGLLDESNAVREYFIRVATAFENARSNSDANTEARDNFLKLAVRLLNYGISADVVTRCNAADIVSYVFENSERNSSNLALVYFYVSCLTELSSCDFFVVDGKVGTLVREWFPKISRDLSLYHCGMLVKWICEGSLLDTDHLYPKKWRNAVESKVIDLVNANKEKSFILECAKNQDDGDYCVAISNYANTFWYLFGWCAMEKREALHEYTDTTIVWSLIFEGLHLARNENLVFVFGALKYICRSDAVLQDEESVIRLMRDGWKKLEEIQATPYYQSAVNKWIEAFIQLPILRCTAFQKEIEYFANEFLKKSSEHGEQVFKSVIAILKQFAEIEDARLVYPLLLDILINTFCTVHVCRKDQRIEYETMNRVRLSYTEYLASEALYANFVQASAEVRLRALNLILRSLENENSLPFCVSTIRTLLRINETSKKRYFGDSVIHRTNHKRLQLLLVLEYILSRKYVRDRSAVEVIDCYEDVYAFAVRSLLSEPHQPSVRYMLEWLLVRVVVNRFSSQYENKFWLSFSEASKMRIGSVCSFIMVAFHVARMVKREDFVDAAVKEILPWSMAQHFTARLYAQSVLANLINQNENMKQKYQIVGNSLASCLKYGNAVKNSIKLQEDFYFSHFHAEEHFTFETILWELPRLSNISRDEWVQVDLYSEFLTQNSGIRLRNESTNCLSRFECPSWLPKAVEMTEEGDAETGETQRKFIPYIEDEMDGDTSGRTRKRSELIVVASLIDRMPNLGGLTRTCEIFAVSTLVLDSLDAARHKEFTALSISAEKHVPLIEVKRYHLFDFLKTMKDKQFCIIGVEQATNSRSLEDFTFPAKSIIVLGNEKEGISADLLPVLDVCVEIPQLGMIRSLNVHVSASLIIWEYAKQHNLPSLRKR